MRRPATKSPATKITPSGLRRRVLAGVQTVGSEKIPIEEARGRILADTIRASKTLPDMNRSAMDGYAVRHSDLVHASPEVPVVLEEIDEVPAGQRSRHRLTRGRTIRIMTGAPVPAGADAVVPIERVRVNGASVSFVDPVMRYRDIRRKGSEIRKGVVLLRAGYPIGPAGMAMLALMDQPRVKVYRKPKVGILSTGDELGPVGKKRPYGHIPDSNRYGLIGLIESAGCIPIDGGRIADSPEKLLTTIKKMRQRVDFIVSTGGVSAGDFDVVKILFRKIGGVRLYRLPIKPGKPQAFGHVGNVPYFGLPGHPVSSMVVFDLMVRPALRKLAGARDIDLPQIRARVVADFPRKSRPWEFPRAIGHEVDGNWTVTPVDSQRSANLRSMTDANGYILLTPDSEPPICGTEVIFVPFPI